MRSITQKVIITVGLILLIAAIWYAVRVLSKPKGANAVAQAKPDSDELEDLKALPYALWTGKNARSDLRGVTLLDRKKVYPGLSFYTDAVNKVYLADIDGRILHTWTVPGQNSCEHAQLLPNGDILAVCFAKALVKLDWNSNVLWIRKRGVHHDVAITPEGNIYAIHRGKFVPYRSRRIAFDQILFLTPEGIEINHWNTYELLDTLKKYHKPSRLDEPGKSDSIKNSKNIYDYYHVNRIQLLPETKLARIDRRFRPGNLMVCLRNVDVLLILDQNTREILWHWGEGILERPHMPTMLENGNILIFDNGVRRKYSRVIEIDPISKKIVWEYKADPPESFFSEYRGSAQRLPNGNTLICESENGHAFEIDRRGNKVWEFWNPEIFDGKRKRIYRLIRVEKSEVPRLLASG